MEFLIFVIVIVFVIWLVTSSSNGKLKTSANATSTNDNYPTPYELLQAAKEKNNRMIVVYRKENQDFFDSLYNIRYNLIFQELELLLN